MGQGQSGSAYRVQPGQADPSKDADHELLREKLEAARAAIDEDGEQNEGEENSAEQGSSSSLHQSSQLTEREAKNLIGEELWNQNIYDAMKDLNGNVTKEDLRAAIEDVVKGGNEGIFASVATTDEAMDIFAADDGFAVLVDDEGIDSSDSESDSDSEGSKVVPPNALGTTTAPQEALTADGPMHTRDNHDFRSTIIASDNKLEELETEKRRYSSTNVPTRNKASPLLHGSDGKHRKSALAVFRKKAKKAHTVETAFLLKSKDK